MKHLLGLRTSSPVIKTLEQIANLTSDDCSSIHNPILQENQQQLSSQLASFTKNSNDIIVPLSAISKAQTILQSFLPNEGKNSDHEKIRKLQTQLETQLEQFTSLTYTQPDVTQSQKYQDRIEKLKLSLEERNYSKLTSNLDTTPKDDAALSSMLYASSVGMNMIVAPISFGVLMYFFAGKLFSWMFGEKYDATRREGQLNIHGVIVGVISGVIMLFIEMILFVIRNHEMDKHLSQKGKKYKKNPFGYDKRTAERTFHG